MSYRINKIGASLIIISLLLSGCTGESEPEPEAIQGCMDENAENYNPEATISDESCIYEVDEENNEPEIILN